VVLGWNDGAEVLRGDGLDVLKLQIRLGSEAAAATITRRTRRTKTTTDVH